jgi:hypothetical protein
MQGYVNDPTTFSGFNSFVSLPSVSTQVVFDAAASYNITQGSAVVGGATMNFSNIQNFSGNISAQVSAIQTAAISSAVNSSSFNSSAGNSSAGNSSIANSNMMNSSTTTSADATPVLGGQSESALQRTVSISVSVNTNMTAITDTQSQDDITISGAQKVSTNCS